MITRILQNLGLLWKALRSFALAFVLAVVTLLFAAAAAEGLISRSFLGLIAAHSNYDYCDEIRRLKSEGRLSEAYELAKFVCAHPDMPGQEDAARLRDELDSELHSLWGRIKRYVKGFMIGSGNSIEEVVGSITSDMVFYGDARDLVKQGYYVVTRKDPDEVVIALSTIGLLTELVDVADWAPAVLKGLRKIGALSRKLGEWIIKTCKRSGKLGRLDDAMKGLFASVKTLVDNLGLARTATVMKYADTPADVADMTKIVLRNPDATWVIVHNGGKEACDLLRSVDLSASTLTTLAKKGPSVLDLVRRGGRLRKYLLIVRYGERIVKTFYLGRWSALARHLANHYPALRWTFFVTAIIGALLILSSVWQGICAIRAFARSLKPVSPAT